MSRRARVPTVSIGDTELHTWFERDRAHVELRDKRTDKTIIEWWDEAVGEAFEDGFLSHKRGLKESAYEYAKDVGLLKPKHRGTR
ncbi:MAG: hypothetical protein ACYDH4_11305 [Candidatus Cryosericum sp.]